MANFDLIVRNGTIVDGTNTPRRVADLGVRNGQIAKIGDLSGDSAVEEIDATGRIVAPGVIDPHTHYDAPLHWDPYVTSSSWHGTTTIVLGNCGFGYAPCRPEQRDRYMMMMVNTEQIPFDDQKAALPWTWETFPEWLDHLRSLPKGVNVGTYLALNPLLVYVKGAEGITQPTTDAQRAKMAELLNEAMDAGALGFSFSYLGKGNGHRDYDGSPVPTDIMDVEDAYFLAKVLGERGEGTIQALVQLRVESRREVAENLARISGRPVIFNVILANDAPENATPDQIALANRWRDTLDWVDKTEKEGLEIFLQSIVLRGWSEVRVADFTLFNSVPVFSDFGDLRDKESRMKMAADQEWRALARVSYDNNRAHFNATGGGFDRYVLTGVNGNTDLEKYIGKTAADVAADKGTHIVDGFFDLLLATDMEADFRINEAISHNPNKAEPILRHRRTIPGASDGGAHLKMFVGGHYPTDLICWMVREEKRISLEEMHHMLSARPARFYGFTDRGLLLEGYRADLYIYDFDKIGFDKKYVTAYDLPTGDWRRTVPAKGIDYVLVNGQIIMKDNVDTGITPGDIVTIQDLSTECEPYLEAAE